MFAVEVLPADFHHAPVITFLFKAELSVERLCPFVIGPDTEIDLSYTIFLGIGDHLFHQAGTDPLPPEFL